jgi:hypothetical protein
VQQRYLWRSDITARGRGTSAGALQARQSLRMLSTARARTRKKVVRVDLDERIPPIVHGVNTLIIIIIPNKKENPSLSLSRARALPLSAAPLVVRPLSCWRV